MNRLILIILINVISIPLYSQDLIKEDRDTFLNELRKFTSDSARINFLLKLAQYYILPIYDHPTNYDTATLLITQAENLNIKTKSSAEYNHILLIKSYYFRTTGKREEGKKTIVTAINLLKKTSQYELLGQAYYELSNYYDYDFATVTVNQRITYIDTAISAFEKSKSYNDLGNCYKMLADLDHLTNQYAKAFTEIRKSLEYYKLTDYKRLEGVYDLFGQLNYAQGNYKEALGYELIALKISNYENDYGPQLGEIEDNVGLTFYKLNDAASAIGHFKRALDIAEQQQDNETIYGLAVEIVDTYIQLNQPQQALLFFKSIEKKYKLPEADIWKTKGYIYNMYLNLYTVLKQYNKAHYYCNQLITKINEPGLDVFRLTVYYNEIIRYFIAVKDYKKGLLYLNKNKEVLESLHDDLGLASNYTLWFVLDTAQGNFKPAVYNILKANFINDTIFNSAKISETRQLEVQYESEKKENDIRLKDQKIKVLTQADLLRQANLDKAMFIRNTTLVATVLLLALAGILFNQYKQKKKSNIVITQRNEQLNNLLQEKEWLLKEIHHRVKNNLQIVISLLNTQSRFLDNKEAIEAIAQSRHRMYAMSLIHQRLYQSENTTSVNMPAYIHELVEYLKTSFESSKQIHFQLNIDAVELDIAQAIPVGLILNEAITNAIKYAFVNREAGNIFINMHSTQQQSILLEVRDNGNGLPDNFDNGNQVSMGMRLINGLTEQVNGKFTLINKNGVTVRLDFTPDSKFKNIADTEFKNNNVL